MWLPPVTAYALREIAPALDPLDLYARLRHGETARYAVDQPHAIRNPGKSPALALLVVLHST